MSLNRMEFWEKNFHFASVCWLSVLERNLTFLFDCLLKNRTSDFSLPYCQTWQPPCEKNKKKRILADSTTFKYRNTGNVEGN